MAIKIIIFVLLIAMLASLLTGFMFLMKDRNDNRKRLLLALGIRVSLAGALIGTIAYGIHSGQLTSQAPWDRELHPERVYNTESAPQ